MGLGFLKGFPIALEEKVRDVNPIQVWISKYLIAVTLWANNLCGPPRHRPSRRRHRGVPRQNRAKIILL